MKSVFAKQIIIEHPLCRHFCPVQWSQPVACAVSYWSSGSHLWALCRQSEHFSHLTQCRSFSSQAPAAAQCVTASLPRMPWPFATPLTSFLPPSFCSGCPGLVAVSQAASECLSEDFRVCSPQHLNPSSKMYHGGHRALLFHHKLPLAFYLQCLHWPLSRQFLFMHSPFFYLTVLFLVYC